eukprot:scaffold92589_cov69-Cyclotella_meneghiniana.AAC.1
MVVLSTSTAEATGVGMLEFVDMVVLQVCVVPVDVASRDRRSQNAPNEKRKAPFSIQHFPQPQQTTTHKQNNKKPQTHQ